MAYSGNSSIQKDFANPRIFSQDILSGYSPTGHIPRWKSGSMNSELLADAGLSWLEKKIAYEGPRTVADVMQFFGQPLALATRPNWKKRLARETI